MLSTGSPRIHTFKAIPSRGFDVAMRIDMPGVHKTVDHAGPAASRPSASRPSCGIGRSAWIRGFGKSSGCYVLSVTP
jgi:hypothetical protein